MTLKVSRPTATETVQTVEHLT